MLSQKASLSPGAPRVNTMASRVRIDSGIAQRPQAICKPATKPMTTTVAPCSAGCPSVSAMSRALATALHQHSGRMRIFDESGEGVSPTETQSAPEAAAMAASKPPSAPKPRPTSSTPSATA